MKDYLRLLYNSAAQYSFPLVRDICKAIDGAAFGSDVLSRIYGAAVDYEGNNTCKFNPKEYDVKPFYGWHWQICSGIVMPIGIGNSSMFQPKPFNFESYAKKVLNDISDSLVALPMVNGTHCMDILAADEDDPSWLVEQRKKEVMIIHRWIREYYDELDANAQYSFPLVMDICKAIDGAAFGSDALSRIYGAAVVYEGNNTCKVNPKEYDVKPFYGWHWQICSEIVMLIGIGNSSMFQPKPFNFESYVKKCMKDFDVIHVKYCGGTHCMDILAADEDDPSWLVEQRKKEVMIIHRWIREYYDELDANGI
ncbi:hypothetical protein KIW84_056577 [Lathyrus oleraceus]|uniref:Uncharacterized protein n=1 Tax=Pisum sativum TaxID=3888 RepID=A0A9D4WZW8_PEA|nr:hypothetical protein KIW84_056577 [Pisum sativum]